MSDFNWDDQPVSSEKEFDWNDQPKSIDTGNVGIHQFLQGATGNFSDEIAGGVEAVGKAAGVDGMGQTFSDVGLSEEGPTLDWEILRDAYKNARDKKRNLYKKQQEKNPVESGIAGVAGAVLSPINKLAKGMSLTKGGALLGGINAAGVTEKEDLVGQAVDTGTGAVIGAGLGYGLEKAAPYVAKLTGQARDLFNKFIRNNPKANADEIVNAAKALGSNATPGMLTEGGMIPRLEQSLSESPSMWGQSVKNKLDDVYTKSQGAIDEMTEGATGLSPFALGEKAKGNMSLKVAEDLTPSSMVFNEIAEQTKNVPLSKAGIKAIQRNIENLDAVRVAGLSGKPAYYHERIGNLKSVDDLKQLGTLLDADMRSSNGAERKILQAIKEKIRDAEEANISRAAIEMSKATKSNTPVAAGRDMVADLKGARAEYAQKMGGYRELSENSRLGNFQGSAGFLDNIDSVKSENFADKLFNVENEAGLKSLQNQFPEAYEMLKGGALKDFKDAVMMGDKSSMAKFRTQFSKLNPESKSRLFGDMVSKGDAVSTLANNMPKNFNPSGTASQNMWNKEAIASNITDIPRYAYYKLLTSDKAQKIGKSLVDSSEQMRQFAAQSPQGFANFVTQLEQKSGALEAPYNFMRDVTPKSGESKPPESAKINKDEILNKLQGTKYQQVLQNAAQKGDQSFNAAHFVLHSRDASYRKQLEDQNK